MRYDPLFPTFETVNEIHIEPPLAGIKLKVCRKYGITVKEFEGRQRGRKIVSIRLEAIKMAVAAGATLASIARSHKRDHTTISHALRKGKIRSPPLVES